MACNLPGSSVHGTSQARILEQVATSFFGDLPDPGIEPKSPALAGGFFTTEPPGRPKLSCSLQWNSILGREILEDTFFRGLTCTQSRK